MARAGWYNENEYRDFPFLTRVDPLSYPADTDSDGEEQLLALPHEAIVDFVAIMALDAAYDEHEGHYIYLHSVRREDPYLYYTFRTTAPGGADEQIIFRRDVATDEEFTSEWQDSESLTGSSVSASDCAGPRWSACLVTGRYDELLELLDDGDEWVFERGLWTVEPARTQSLYKSYLRSINLGNFSRTHALPPDQCGGESEEAVVIHVNATCLAGDLKFKEGFNCLIRQDTLNNAIIIGAAVGGGEGRPCTEVSLYESEAPPSGSTHLSGGPACNEIVKTVNGKGGRRLTIRSGPGFRVYGDPEVANTLVLDRQLQDFAICLVDESSVSLGSEG